MVDGSSIIANHHLIGDHSTLEVMYEEIEMIMDGRTESFLPTAIPQCHRRGAFGCYCGGARAFFSHMLGDVDHLPPIWTVGYLQRRCYVTEALMLPQELNDTLRGHAQRLGVSLASLCHLAWAQVVAGTSGQSIVVFGTVLFGRMQGGSGSDRALGLFINTLPIRIDVEGSSVLDSVRRCRRFLAPC